MAFAAVVLGHRQSDSVDSDDFASALAATIQAIEAQQAVADAKVLVAEERPKELPADWHFAQVQNHKNPNAALTAAIEKALETLPLAFLQSPDTWFWPVAAGQQPHPDASRAFLARVEATPSAALLVPKLVASHNPKLIESFGLTLTRRGQYFERVTNEYDQSQHDGTDDLLAAELLGSWVRVAAWKKLEGPNPALNERAGLVDFGMRLRLSGWRVVATGLARVSQPRPVDQTADFAWRASALAAGMQLRAVYAPLAGAILLGLLQPVSALLQTLGLLLFKRPERILTLWWASIAHFFSLPRLLGQRSKAKADRASRRALQALYAGSDDVNRANRAKYQAIEAVTQVVDTGRENDPAGSGLASKSFAAAGGFWWLLLVALVSLRFWPADVAVSGGGVVPLAPSWIDLFNRAGSSWQLLNGGFAAPSDPFNWVLLTLGSLTAWAPSLGVALALFLAKPLAFLGAWRVISLLTNRTSVLVLGGLAFAFWPTLSTAAAEGRLGTLLASVLLPWFAYTLARLLRLGDAARNSTQTWTWLASSALLAAAISAGAPSLTPVVAAVILLLGVYRWRRLGYLIWLPVPLIVLWAPLAVFAVLGVEHWAGLFLDPGVPQDSQAPQLWQWLLGGNAQLGLSLELGWAAAVTVLLALLAPLTRRALPALWLWLATALALAAAWAVGQVEFINNSPLGTAPEFVTGSGLAQGSLAGLLLAVLAAMTLDSLANRWRAVLASVWVLATAALGLQFVVTTPALSWGPAATQPAVVQLASATGLNLLTLSPNDPSSAEAGFRVSLQSAAGVHLEDLSVAQRIALPKLLSGSVESSARGRELTSLSADLIAANGAALTERLANLQVGFVLVPESETAADLGGALDTFAELEAVGKTSYGRLWRVVEADTSLEPAAYPAWSITKGVQFATLIFFGLLALPTRRTSKPKQSELSDLDEESDLFENAEVD